MRSVDTNVVVRFLTADDDDQFQRAKRLFEAGDILILTSVMLQTEWVLRSSFRLGNEAIVHAFRSLVGHEGVHIENDALLMRALGLTEQGLDFADALHLAGGARCTDFVSFDRPLARRASALSTVSVVEP